MAKFGEWATKAKVLKESEMTQGRTYDLSDIYHEGSDVIVTLMPTDLPDDGDQQFYEDSEVKCKLENIRTNTVTDPDNPFTDFDMVNVATGDTIPHEALTDEAHRELMKILDRDPVVNRLLAQDRDDRNYDDSGVTRMGQRRGGSDDFFEGADSDVTSWMSRFKAYDDLRASKHPVAEQVSKKDIPAVQRKDSGDKDWKVTMGDLEKERDGKMSDSKTLAKKSDATLKESPDPEVVAWMRRLDKLGKM